MRYLPLSIAVSVATLLACLFTCYLGLSLNAQMDARLCQPEETITMTTDDESVLTTSWCYVNEELHTRVDVRTVRDKGDTEEEHLEKHLARVAAQLAITPNNCTVHSY